MTETETREHVDTRESLLDAAESLFSEHGIQAASLRAITQRAGANLAAVHYHFGSKEGLVRAVFSRRLKPLHEERMKLLDACDLDSAGAVEQVLKAFMAPLLRGARETPEGTRGFARLMGRAFSEPAEEVRGCQRGARRDHPAVHGVCAGCCRTFRAGAPVALPLHRRRPGATRGCGYLLEKYSQGMCQPAMRRGPRFSGVVSGAVCGFPSAALPRRARFETPCV